MSEASAREAAHPAVCVHAKVDDRMRSKAHARLSASSSASVADDDDRRRLSVLQSVVLVSRLLHLLLKLDIYI